MFTLFSENPLSIKIVLQRPGVDEEAGHITVTAIPRHFPADKNRLTCRFL